MNEANVSKLDREDILKRLAAVEATSAQLIELLHVNAGAVEELVKRHYALSHRLTAVELAAMKSGDFKA